LEKANWVDALMGMVGCAVAFVRQCAGPFFRALFPGSFVFSHPFLLRPFFVILQNMLLLLPKTIL